MSDLKSGETAGRPNKLLCYKNRPVVRMSRAELLFILHDLAGHPAPIGLGSEEPAAFTGDYILEVLSEIITDRNERERIADELAHRLSEEYWLVKPPELTKEVMPIDAESAALHDAAEHPSKLSDRCYIIPITGKESGTWFVLYRGRDSAPIGMVTGEHLAEAILICEPFRAKVQPRPQPQPRQESVGLTDDEIADLLKDL